MSDIPSAIVHRMKWLPHKNNMSLRGDWPHGEGYGSGGVDGRDYQALSRGGGGVDGRGREGDYQGAE